jgi:hypothetical protein
MSEIPDYLERTVAESGSLNDELALVQARLLQQQNAIMAEIAAALEAQASHQSELVAGLRAIIRGRM